MIRLSSRLVTGVISTIIHLLVEMKSDSEMMCAGVHPTGPNVLGLYNGHHEFADAFSEFGGDSPSPYTPYRTLRVEVTELLLP